MKTNTLTVVAATCGLFVTANAQTGKPPEDAKEKKTPAKMVEKFDKDGDGKLNDEERAEAKASEGKMKVGKKRAEMIAKFDKDGDGELNKEEEAALRADKKQKLIEQFDEDKDGKLNEEEEAKMQKLIQQRHDSHKKPADEAAKEPAEETTPEKADEEISVKE